MSDMAWEILGGIVVALVIFDWAHHYWHVATRIWAGRRAFNQPTRTLPAPGVVTLNGVVSAIGNHDHPVKVVLEEYGRGMGRGAEWDQTSRSVEVHPFELELPEVGVKVVVEPGEDVALRSSAFTTEISSVESSEIPTDWARDDYTFKYHRQRVGVLGAGDLAIVKGVLTEKREAQIVATEYRSQKGQTTIEYVLHPPPDEPMRIDSITMFDEFKERYILLGPYLTFGVIIVPFCYVHKVWVRPVHWVSLTVGVIALFYLAIRLVFAYARIDRLPWFERPINAEKPYSFMD